MKLIGAYYHLLLGKKQRYSLRGHYGRNDDYSDRTMTRIMKPFYPCNIKYWNANNIITVIITLVPYYFTILYSLCILHPTFPSPTSFSNKKALSVYIGRENPQRRPSLSKMGRRPRRRITSRLHGDYMRLYAHMHIHIQIKTYTQLLSLYKDIRISSSTTHTHSDMDIS